MASEAVAYRGSGGGPPRLTYAAFYNKSPVFSPIFQQQRSETNNAMALPYSFSVVRCLYSLQLKAMYAPPTFIFVSQFYFIWFCDVKIS